MKRKLNSLIEKLNKNVMYLTENPINAEYSGYKYFLCWRNANTIYFACKTQIEIIGKLEELIIEKIVCVDSYEFEVIK